MSYEYLESEKAEGFSLSTEQYATVTFSPVSSMSSNIIDYIGIIQNEYVCQSSSHLKFILCLHRTHKHVHITHAHTHTHTHTGVKRTNGTRCRYIWTIELLAVKGMAETSPDQTELHNSRTLNRRSTRWETNTSHFFLKPPLPSKDCLLKLLLVDLQGGLIKRGPLTVTRLSNARYCFLTPRSRNHLFTKSCIWVHLLTEQTVCLPISVQVP